MSGEIQNRKAAHEYHILDSLETGIELKGTEVKSLRAGKGDLTDSFAKIEKGQVWLYQFDIAPYLHGNRENHEPKRPKKLLLHQNQIRKLFSEASLRGRALIPLKGYFNQHGLFKIILAVGSGKALRDKRQATLEKETRRELDRALKTRLKR